jgi:hypothetical protein
MSMKTVQCGHFEYLVDVRTEFMDIISESLVLDISEDSLE